MIRDHFWTTEEGSNTNEDAWMIEEGTGFWEIEEATEITLNNYLHIYGTGVLSVAPLG